MTTEPSITMQQEPPTKFHNINSNNNDNPMNINMSEDNQIVIQQRDPNTNINSNVYTPQITSQTLRPEKDPPKMPRNLNTHIHRIMMSHPSDTGHVKIYVSK